MPVSHHSTTVKNVILNDDNLTFDNFIQVSRFFAKVEIAETALIRVDRARKCVEEKLRSGETFYGINTGFGALANVRIPDDKLDELQINLIRSHSCGVGEPLPIDIVRGVLVLRIQTILKGYSGVRRETVQLMQTFLNCQISPFVPMKGSVGASGDLAPLAHIALNLIGEGKVFYEGQVKLAKEVFEQLRISPLSPKAKEGLSLINGTQVMTAIGLLSCYDGLQLLKSADIAASISLDATMGTLTAFKPEIQNIRPHAGQAIVAKNVTEILSEDSILSSHTNCTKVQDPYSFRCVPQVHGAARNAYTHVFETLMCEANSCTDNPLVFTETKEILSGGNFHGEPVAMVLDYFAIAIAEIANISERRIEKLVNPHMSGLPPFLTTDSGLKSGYMIPHVVAAALVNENKILCTPASVDSIPTSAEKEDHVSMGMTSANKLRTIINNTSYVLAIEIIAGIEGLEFHLPLQPGIGAKAATQWLRSYVAPIKDNDRSISEEIELISKKILAGELVDCVNASFKNFVLL